MDTMNVYFFWASIRYFCQRSTLTLLCEIPGWRKQMWPVEPNEARLAGSGLGAAENTQIG